MKIHRNLLGDLHDAVIRKNYDDFDSLMSHYPNNNTLREYTDLLKNGITNEGLLSLPRLFYEIQKATTISDYFCCINMMQHMLTNNCLDSCSAKQM